MDLDFSNKNNRFNARVAAIIYNNDKTKVLLFNIVYRDFIITNWMNYYKLLF